MKKSIKIIAIVAALALPTYTVLAEMEMDHMNSDFKEMNQMMDKAEKSTNPKDRQQYMQKHMAMMMKQMDSMDHMMEGKDDKMMSSEGVGNRMDMMQMMMEQMMRQQNMMMQDMK